MPWWCKYYLFPPARIIERVKRYWKHCYVFFFTSFVFPLSSLYTNTGSDEWDESLNMIIPLKTLIYIENVYTWRGRHAHEVDNENESSLKKNFYRTATKIDYKRHPPTISSYLSIHTIASRCLICLRIFHVFRWRNVHPRTFVNYIFSI